MGWLSRAFGRSPEVSFAIQTQAAIAQFAVDSTSIPAQILGLTSYSDPVAKAAAVDRDVAIQVPAVKRARDLIASTIGQLPADVFNSKHVVARNPLLDQPERNRARVITMSLTVEDLLFYGRAWWQVTERDGAGWPTFVKRVDPRFVDDGTGWPCQVGPYYEPGKVYINGKHVPDADIIRFDSPNDPLLVAGARAIRTALRLDAAAANYAEGTPPADYFEPRDGVDPAEDEEIQAILDAWAAARRARSTAYIPAALKYNISGFDPQKLQLQEARQHAVVEIARAAGIDPEALGVSTTSRTYFNAFDKRKEFTDFVLSAYVAAIEDRLSMGDVTRQGHTVRFNLDAFLRSSTKERYEAYEIGLRVGAIADEAEVREMEGKPPVEMTAESAATAQDIARMAQQIYLAVPTVMTQEEARALLRSVGADLPELPAPEEETPTVTNTKFDAPELAVTLDATAPGATFKVNRESRTITGLAVPFGAVAESGGLLWSFGPGTLKYADAKRVKLLVSHDWSRAIGYAASLTETDEGLIASFKVARGPAGDEALAMAEDGVWDGLSIGVAAGGRFDVRDGVNHSVSAPLVEISLTPAPAYDGARVTQVAAEAAHTERQSETVTDKTNAPASTEAPAVTAEKTEAVAPVINVAAPTFDGLAEAIGTAIAAALPTPAEKPEVVTASTEVTSEPLPYRFDGRRGTHDFSTDLFAVARHNDGEAGVRLDKFMAAAFDVDGTNVASLNPNKQRPDLYVDNMDFTTPLADAVSKGTLADRTPFVLPKFSASANLVGDHTEGSAPATKGSFSATSQTVTPTAMSGVTEVTREVIDAGGSPQVSGLIWAEVIRAYNEAREAKVAALLNAATPTALATLVAASEDEVLADPILAGLASLQFIRGGARMRDFFVSGNLFAKLAAAKYTDGRSIFPLVSPQNTPGSTEGDFGAIKIGAYVARPAWALSTGTAGDSESSYLFNRGDVSQWSSAPQRFTFDYRVELVDIAVWGYVAQAITRDAGVRELAYDDVAP
jgi:HK97 family phage prohead protease